MRSKHNAASRLLAVCALVTLSLMSVAEAQPYGAGRDGPGYMMGPGMMDRQQFGRMCNPRSAGFAEWRIDRLGRVVKPTDAQRAKFDEFKAGLFHRYSDDNGRADGGHGEAAGRDVASGEDSAAYV